MLGLCFVLLSAAMFLTHYLIFRDSRNLFFYLVHNIAFVPINVLIVTLIIDRLLRMREKQAMLKKLNMVIGAFYSEVGNQLLKQFVGFDPNSAAYREALRVNREWRADDFRKTVQMVSRFEHQIDCRTGDLAGLKVFLQTKSDFLLGLLENSNLLEHDAFTELLWAVFHLGEELSYRADTKRLSEPDYRHLAGDIKRAYRLVIIQWLEYMKHLQVDYPYLFSLAVRLNPFDPDARVEIP
jgi:hypothetical protein